MTWINVDLLPCRLTWLNVGHEKPV